MVMSIGMFVVFDYTIYFLQQPPDMSDTDVPEDNCAGQVLLLGPVRELVFDYLGWSGIVLLSTSKAIYEHCMIRVPEGLKKSERNRIAFLNEDSSLEDCVSAMKLLFNIKSNLLQDFIISPHEFNGSVFKPGEMVDVLDSVRKWYDSVIIDTRVNGPDQEILVHYKSWSNKWDEWINVNTDNHRIAPVLTQALGRRGDAYWSEHRNSQIWRVWIPSSLAVYTNPTAGFETILSRLELPNPTRSWDSDELCVSILAEFFESYLVKREMLKLKTRDRCIYRSDIFPLRLAEDGETKLADRYLIHIHDDSHSVIVMRRIGPYPFLGFPAQKVWNKPTNNE